MSIQANINQTISLAGMLLSQTPLAGEGRIAAQHKREKKEAQKAQYMSKLDKQIEAKNKAADALAAENARLREANSLDLSKLDERARPRVERAYKKAERDTKYLTKKDDAK